MNDAGLRLLRCPVCQAGLTLTEDGKVCRCTGAKVHCFDVARSGYLNLDRSSHGGAGDSAAAVRARRAFLDAGYYQALSDTVNAVLESIPSETVLDAGCGEGYYTNRMASGRTVLGVDLSRNGIEYAARRAKQQGGGAVFAVAGLFDLPVPDASLDVVVSIFAPCAEREFLRVLKPGGHCLLVGAGERHLMGLKRLLYDNPYCNNGREDLPVQMEQVSCRKLSRTVVVEGNDLIVALFSMTPYYWRTSEADCAKLCGVEKLTTELDFDVFLFRKLG